MRTCQVTATFQDGVFEAWAVLAMISPEYISAHN